MVGGRKPAFTARSEAASSIAPLEPRVARGEAHGPRGAVRGRVGDVARIARGAEAGDLAEDVRAALYGMIQRFEEKDGGAFREDEPLAVRAERTARRLRMLVVRREDAHRLPGPDDAVGEGRVRAAGEHGVRAPGADGLHGEPQRVRAGGAGGDDAVREPLRLVPRGDGARRGGVHRPGDPPRRAPGAPRRIDPAPRNPALPRRLVRRDEREAAEAVRLLVQSLMRLARDLAGDAAIEHRGIDRFDAFDARRAAAQRVEGGLLAAAERGDEADAGDGDAAAGHGWLSSATTSIMSPKVFIARALSSGMLMPNCSSMAKRMVSASRESMPASARAVWGVSFSSGICFSLRTISISFRSISARSMGRV